MLMLGSTCFGHHYAHHQELTTIALVTTEAVWFCKEPDGLCGNQRYRRELLMMGIMVPETCWSVKNQTACVVTNAIVVSS